MKKEINRITREDVEAFARTVNFSSSSTLDLYQKIATKSAIYPGQGTPLGLAYVALKSNGEAGEFAEHVGKAMRDDNLMEPIPDETGLALRDNTLTPERREAIVKELGDMLWYISAGANELGLSLSDIALANLRKLCDRGERDALRGSGDDR